MRKPTEPLGTFGTTHLMLGILEIESLAIFIRPQNLLTRVNSCDTNLSEYLG